MNRRQTIPKELRYTRNQFDQDFPDDDTCLETIKQQRWPSGMIYCDTCEKERKHYRVTGRTAYACDRCGHHIYPLAGTIFEKSTTSLRTWFQAMYLMGSTRCGISAKQIQRETGVTYKTAWRMFKQIRMLLSEDMQLEGSPVEMDETLIGGRRRKRTQFDPSNKTWVAGIVERKGGRVYATVIDENTKKTLQGIAQEKILPKSIVFTDDAAQYHGLDTDYHHHRINHSQGVYVMGNVHTNTIEGFWSLVKRGLGGVYQFGQQEVFAGLPQRVLFPVQSPRLREFDFPVDCGEGFATGVVEALCTSRTKSSRVKGLIVLCSFFAGAAGRLGL